MFALIACYAWAETTVVELNSKSSATTVGAVQRLIDSKHLASMEVGEGGQLVFEFKLTSTSPQTMTDLTISTCESTLNPSSNFDTFIALYTKDPTGTSPVAHLAENDDDISCSIDTRLSTISLRAAEGTYYVLVTGKGSTEGPFTLNIQGTAPTPTPLPWGLDRIDQRALPLNSQYSVADSGKGVWVYLLDSGVLTTHEEFEGRAFPGFDFVTLRNDSLEDCTGHGTHSAGTVVGRNFGVAKRSNLISVRIFNCDNVATVATIVHALEWVLVDSRIENRVLSMISLMFSAKVSGSEALESVISNVIKAGIPIVAPAGDDNKDACENIPGSYANTLAVGSVDRNDARSSFSNFGQCADVYAPGRDVMSSWHTSNTGTRNLSGTAQATAYMSGIVSVLMGLNGAIEPERINSIIKSTSTFDAVTNVADSETPRLGFVRSVPAFSGEPPSPSNVFLFYILRFDSGIESCSSSANVVESLRRATVDLLDVRNDIVTTECFADSAALSQVQEHGTSHFVQFRVQEEERRAGATFALIEIALSSDKENTVSAFSRSFQVVEQPWAVDSRKVVFWGAPVFADTEYSTLSRGAIAGIVVGTLCALLVVLVALYVVYRLTTNLDAVESMEGSADFEKGPVHFNDHSNADSLGSSGVLRSFRNVVKSMSIRGSRSAPMHTGAGGRGGVDGINRMGSYIGGPDAPVAEDVVRMHSVGGEAFAGLDNLSRNSPQLQQAGSRSRKWSSKNMLSFRGAGNLVVNNSSANQGAPGTAAETGERFIDESEDMRMHSLGGEAFALIGRKLSALNPKDVNGKGGP